MHVIPAKLRQANVIQQLPAMLSHSNPIKITTGNDQPMKRSQNY